MKILRTKEEVQDKSMVCSSSKVVRDKKVLSKAVFFKHLDKIFYLPKSAFMAFLERSSVLSYGTLWK